VIKSVGQHESAGILRISKGFARFFALPHVAKRLECGVFRRFCSHIGVLLPGILIAPYRQAVLACLRMFAYVHAMNWQEV
jgi:hypothetical protein